MQAFFVKNYGPLWQYLSNRKYIIVFENMEDSEVTSLEQPFMRRLGDAGSPAEPIQGILPWNLLSRLMQRAPLPHSAGERPSLPSPIGACEGPIFG
jgi:hypothetical protein